MWKIVDKDNSFLTQPFRIKYARQDIRLCMMISFTLPLERYEVTIPYHYAFHWNILRKELNENHPAWILRSWKVWNDSTYAGVSYICCYIKVWAHELFDGDCFFSLSIYRTTEVTNGFVDFSGLLIFGFYFQSAWFKPHRAYCHFSFSTNHVSYHKQKEITYSITWLSLLRTHYNPIYLKWCVNLIGV